MAVDLLFRKRETLSESKFVEIVIWRVPRSVRGCAHPFKYRLALVSAGICVLRCDNEAGKGDHRHVGMGEAAYHVKYLATLQADFWKDVTMWRTGQ